MIREEIQNIRLSEKDLERFGAMIGVVSLVLGTVSIVRRGEASPYWFVVGGAFLGMGILAPRALRGVYKWWMSFGVVMGWVMTRVILGILFYGITTPLAVISRLVGKQFIDFDFKNRARATYWEARSGARDPKSIEKQF